MTEAPHPFRQHGRMGPLARLALVNLLLNILTLSLWRFWGKTRVRRFLWGQTTAWDDAVEYTGTGRELFLGFLLVLLAVFLPLIVAYAALQVLMEGGNAWAGAALVMLQGVVLFLAGAGLYRARRYQLSRTQWRGIRGGLEGKAWVYGLLFAGTLIGSGLTLGWLWPLGHAAMGRYAMSHTTFGDRRFDCRMKAGPLYRRFVAAWGLGLLILVVIGILVGGLFNSLLLQSNIWVAALAPLLGLALLGLLIAVPMAMYFQGYYHQLAATTGYEGARFSLGADWGALLRLGIGNWLLTMLSLGALRPLAALRTMRFACTHLAVDGVPDFHAIQQNSAQLSRTGEGLAAVFDGAGEF